MSFVEWRPGCARWTAWRGLPTARRSGKPPIVGYASPSAFSAMVRRSLGKPLRELIHRTEAPASE